MKKYTIVVVFMLMGFSAQGMQKMSRCAQAALRGGQLVQQTRSKVSLAALAKMHKSLPRASFKFSPLLGAANALNGTISRELKHGNKELAGAFFNQIQEEPICYTVLPFKVALSLTPKLMGELLALHGSGALYKPEFFESDTSKEWHALFNGSRDKKNFKYQVKKQLLNLMQQEPDQEKVRELLLAAVYFKGDTADDLKTFLYASKTVLSEDEIVQNKKLMTDYADTFVALTTTKKDMSFLQAEEIAEMRGYCSEKAVWSVLNMLFYNPEKGILDLSMVPEEIQKTCLREFVSFIQKYSNPNVSKFYQSSHKDFLNLVHGIEGVRYLRGSVEIPGERSETLKILNHLLGTQAASYQELAKILSVSEKRMVTFAEPTDKEYGPVGVKVSDKKAEMIFSGTWNFDRGHVGFVFDRDKNNTIKVKEIKKLDDAVNSGGALIKFIPGWLHKSIDWRNDSVKQVNEFLTRNKVTTAELNELSKSLREKKSTLLHTAIEQERADLVSYFLDRGVDQNSVDSNGDIPLSSAIQQKNERIVYLLVSAGANLNYKDTHGRSPLISALILRSERVAEVLIDAGALVNEKDYKLQTALMAASINNLPEGVKLLIGAGALVNEKDNEGQTALMGASWEGNEKIVKLLIDAGALVNEKDGLGRTALMHGSNNGRMEVVQALLSAGALVNERDRNGYSALYFAYGKNMEMIKTLLKAGADPNSRDNRGMSVFYLAVKHYDKNKLRALLDAGACYHGDAFGDSPLVAAICPSNTPLRESDKEVIDLLWDAPGAFSDAHKADVLEMVTRTKVVGTSGKFPDWLINHLLIKAQSLPVKQSWWSKFFSWKK